MTGDRADSRPDKPRRPNGPRRIVVKIGSSSLTLNGHPDAAIIRRISRQLVNVRAAGTEAVLVSSGAIAAGLAPLGFDKRPSDMPSLQAAAAVGQRRLMDMYAAQFERKGVPVGQVLLTQYDIVNRRHYLNARKTLDRLLALGCLPIVNENDTVAVEEIRYGDNDRLAALVANLVSADLLIMLSDVEGLFTKPPGRGDSLKIDRVDSITPELIAGTRGRSALGSGGMTSKLEAARMATMSGVDVVIAQASLQRVIEKIVDGEVVGTFFPARAHRMSAKKLWIAWAPAAKGRLVVDAGAAGALVEGGKSLLAAGVRSIEGSFSAGDAVEVAGPEGSVIAKGIVGYDSERLATLMGKSAIGEVIHRDGMVLL